MRNSVFLSIFSPKWWKSSFWSRPAADGDGNHGMLRFSRFFEKFEPKIFKIFKKWIFNILKYDVRTLSLGTLGTLKRPQNAPSDVSTAALRPSRNLELPGSQPEIFEIFGSIFQKSWYPTPIHPHRRPAGSRSLIFTILVKKSSKTENFVFAQSRSLKKYLKSTPSNFQR